LAAWGVLMLSWAVVTVAEQLPLLHMKAEFFYSLLFPGMALWLAITPWLAQRSYDLYRFSLADLDFLCDSPIRAPIVAVCWFLKALFTRWNGILVLGCGILASSLSIAAKNNDILGLAYGLLAGAGFVVVANAALWLLGLLRYRPLP